jgi:hypothetical protein
VSWVLQIANGYPIWELYHHTDANTQRQQLHRPDLPARRFLYVDPTGKWLFNTEAATNSTRGSVYLLAPAGALPLGGAEAKAHLRGAWQPLTFSISHVGGGAQPAAAAAPAPANLALEVVVPESATAGQELLVQAPDGRQIRAMVPEGSKPGQVLRLQLPPLPSGDLPAAVEHAANTAAAADAGPPPPSYDESVSQRSNGGHQRTGLLGTAIAGALVGATAVQLIDALSSF